MENFRPFTMNKDAYIKLKEENLTKFGLLRHGGKPLPVVSGNTTIHVQDSKGYDCNFTATEENLLSILSQYGLHLSSVKDLVRIYGDEFHTELEVIAHVVAYFDISSKRLIDDIAKIFETFFAHNFGQVLKRTLVMKLELVGEGGSEICARYIKEEDDIQVKRDYLTRQQDILVKAIDTVDRFFKK
jgi:hypothetical protein